MMLVSEPKSSGRAVSWLPQAFSTYRGAVQSSRELCNGGTVRVQVADAVLVGGPLRCWSTVLGQH